LSIWSGRRDSNSRPYVEAERLRLLERIEEAVAGALHRAGWSPDDAVQDSLRFIAQTMATTSAAVPALPPTELCLLNSKATAELIGVSLSTLQHARCNRPHLDMPPARRVGRRNAGYDLGDILRWAERRKFLLRWQHVPTRYVLGARGVYSAMEIPTRDALLQRLRLGQPSMQRWTLQKLTRRQRSLDGRPSPLSRVALLTRSRKLGPSAPTLLAETRAEALAL